MRADKTTILKEYFGYPCFRKSQELLIDRLMSGSDVMGVMPTGGGKSICYQVPAMLMEGTSIVISPLISLMKDQVDNLREIGIPSAYINSAMDYSQIKEIARSVRSNKIKLLYIAPERLENETFLRWLAEVRVPLFVVDEAHCVSQWGHDFRTSYLKIKQTVDCFSQRPIVGAFTATATLQVRDDIRRLLGLVDPFEHVSGFDRSNLYFEVTSVSDKAKRTLQYVKENKDSPGIVYCATRKTVDSLCQKLQAQGYAATKYHAGLTDEERTKNQDAFINDRACIIVATTAFGMGIDKANVRYVLHYNMPKSMEHYYQEAGRAGRDGEKARCLMLYSPSDIFVNKRFIDPAGLQASTDYKKLQDMIDFCNTDGCLRKNILAYFGETLQKDCGNCGNCLHEMTQSDITLEGQKIISCVIRMGQRFGSTIVCDVLKGAKNERILRMGFDKLSTYGIMKEYSAKAVKEMISYLVAEGYLDMTGGEYPIMKVTEKAVKWLKSGEKLTIKRVIEKQEQRKESIASVDDALFRKLKALRRIIAEEEKVPPYIIFSDVSLRDMCVKLPHTEEEMLDVSGVGRYKMEKFGYRFLAVVKEQTQKSSKESRS